MEGIPTSRTDVAPAQATRLCFVVACYGGIELAQSSRPRTKVIDEIARLRCGGNMLPL